MKKQSKYQVLNHLYLFTYLACFFCSSALYAQIEFKLTANDAASADQFGRSVSIYGNYAVVGAPADDDRGDNSGSAYIFIRYADSHWAFDRKLTAYDGTAGDMFGIAVCVYQNFIAVGAIGDDDAGESTGAAYVFKREGTNWLHHAKLTADDKNAGDKFGSSVAISYSNASFIDNVVIIGAPENDIINSNTGAAYIFQLIGTTWSQMTKLAASDYAADDFFGLSVAIDGDLAIVGSYGNDDAGEKSGSAYIFKCFSTTWYQEAKLLSSDAAAYDWFGQGVGIHEDHAIIGAAGDDDKGQESGAAYIFERTISASWNQITKLVPNDGAEEDWFGRSVAINGDYAIAGAHGDGVSSGSAYIFQRAGTSWNQTFKLTASDAASFDNFGENVSINENAAIIGAWGNDDNGSASGSAYIYQLESAFAEPDCLIALDGYNGAIPMAWDTPSEETSLKKENLLSYNNHENSAQHSLPILIDQNLFYNNNEFNITTESANKAIWRTKKSNYSHLMAPTGYDIYRSNSSGGNYTKIASNINRNYYRDEAVNNGQTYYYKIKALYSTGESDFTKIAHGRATTEGYILNSSWVSTTPAIDGNISSGEWSSATKVDMSYPVQNNSVELYFMNDNDFLYVAIDNKQDESLDHGDQMYLFFDEDHDHEWPSSASSEGNIAVYWDGGQNEAVARERTITGYWPDNLTMSDYQAASGVSKGISISQGNVQFEVKIDLENSILNVSPTDVFSVEFSVLDFPSQTWNGSWPQAARRFNNLVSGNSLSGKYPFAFGDLNMATPSENPVLVVNPEVLDFGITETTKPFNISNSNGGTLTWNITDNRAWITSIVPSSASGNRQVNVTISRARLSAGNYTGKITVTSNGGTKEITVNMTVPSTYRATVKIVPDSTEINIRNSGTVDIVIEDVENLGSFEFSLYYDKNIVQIANNSDVTLGSFLSSTGRTAIPVGPQIDNNAGMVTFGAATIGSAAGPDGNGVLATIRWTPQAEGSTA